MFLVFDIQMNAGRIINRGEVHSTLKKLKKSVIKIHVCKCGCTNTSKCTKINIFQKSWIHSFYVNGVLSAKNCTILEILTTYVVNTGQSAGVVKVEIPNNQFWYKMLVVHGICFGDSSLHWFCGIESPRNTM